MKTLKEQYCPTLSQARDWSILQAGLPLSILKALEEIVAEYENPNKLVEYEDYPLIIQWWEGLVDTEEVIEQYL